MDKNLNKKKEFEGLAVSSNYEQRNKDLDTNGGILNTQLDMTWKFNEFMSQFDGQKVKIIIEVLK